MEGENASEPPSTDTSALDSLSHIHPDQKLAVSARKPNRSESGQGGL